MIVFLSESQTKRKVRSRESEKVSKIRKEKVDEILHVLRSMLEKELLGKMREGRMR
jgi:hypothetical protein